MFVRIRRCVGFACLQVTGSLSPPSLSLSNTHAFPFSLSLFISLYLSLSLSPSLWDQNNPASGPLCSKLPHTLESEAKRGEGGDG